MNEVPESIARWLEQKRRRDRASAAVLAVITLGGGFAVFLLVAVLVYSVFSVLFTAFLHSHFNRIVWPGLCAFGLASWLFARIMKTRRNELDLDLDPLGFWIIRDILSVGPRLMLDGLRQVRSFEDLGEMNVAACARALAYLAAQTRAVSREDLMQHCSEISWQRLTRELLFVEGVLFLGEHGSKITLIEPFRLLLRAMLPPDQSWTRFQSRAKAAHERESEPVPPQPGPRPGPEPVRVNEPERLSPYELLGLTPSASLVEIKAAYRKRVKACHPDLFAGMDPNARALAERWTKALNAAYAALNGKSA